MYISCDPSVGPTRSIELGKTLRLYPNLATCALGTKVAGSGIYIIYVPSRRAKLLSLVFKPKTYFFSKE